MNRQSFITILLTVLMSMTGAKAFAHDIAVANDDGVTIYYKWANDAKTELAVTYWGDHNDYRIYWQKSYSGEVVIPESVVYNDIIYRVTSIGYEAFDYCSELTSVTIPNSVTSIGREAFNGCSSLSSVTIPNSVISIGSYAFGGTPMVDNQPNGLVYIDNFLYLYKGDMPENTSIVIEEGTRGIAGGAFNDRKNLISVTIPNSVKSIGDNAFYGCSGLTSLSIPNSVKIIDYDAFYGCTGLTSLIIPNSVTTIGVNAFRDCTSLYSAIIGNGVTTIGSCAFYNCYMTSVIIGSSVTSIGNKAFDYNNLVKILWLANTPPSGYSQVSGTINYVSNDLYTSITNTKIKYPFLSSYFDVDGIRYVPVSPSERTCDAIDCVYDESATNTKVASTVEYKGVTLDVKNIRPYLAYNNKFIKTLTVDNDGELADHVFSYCSNMKTATLGQKVSAIGSHAFQGCSLIETIDIPDIVPVLNIYTFADCVSLKEIKIKPLMTDIKNSVFNNCSRLTKVIIADSETVLNLGSNQSGSGSYIRNYGNPLFSSCPLDTVYIGRNIDYDTSPTYGYSPFYRNTSLRAVKITDEETEISENEFYGCTNLQRVVIGDGVTKIDKWAFSDCSSLKFFAFGTQVQTIEQEAFSDCASVIEISSKAATPPVCGAQALDDINKWECKLFVPDGATEAYQDAEQWMDFFFTEEGEGTVAQGSSAQAGNNQKCETPTITVDGGTIKFNCKTGGVIYHYSLTSTDAKNDISNNNIEVKNSYTITVYASKEGYIDSDVAHADFQVAAAGKKGDVNGDNIVNVADHVELSKIILGQGQ